MSTKIQLQNIADTAITAISALGAPKVTVIGYPGNDTAADTAGGQVITLAGTGFQSGLNILIGSVSASVVTYISSTQVTFVAPASAAGTYVMYVINPDGGTGISIPGISYSGTPAWTTAAGTLGSVTETAAVARTFVATGDAPVTYALASGTVPPGSTLDSATGLLSGTAPPSAGATTYSFVIRATDAQNQDTDRSFSITINSDVVTWSNPTLGATVALTHDIAMSAITVNAVSAAGAAVTYTANTLPVGITLSGNTISGTPTVVSTVTTALTATAATTRTAVNVISWTVALAIDSLLNLTTLLLPGSATTFVRDASANNFAVTVVGDTRPNTFNPYLTGWSNSFDGTGDYLTVGTGSSGNLSTANFTIELWFYGVGLIATRSLIQQDETTWRLALEQSKLVWNTAGANRIISTDTFLNNQWNHVAVTSTGGTDRLFLNGVLQGSYSGTGRPSNSDGSVSIGINLASVGAVWPFLGYISNLRLIKGTAVYTANFTPSTAPLTAVAGTSLLTCQSNRFVDNSANNFAITRTGDVRVESFSPFQEPATTRGSAYFDGTNDFLSVPNNTALDLGSGDYTIEGWWYFTDTSNQALVSKYTGSGGYVVQYQSNNLRMVINTGGPGADVVYSFSWTAIPNTWNHVVITRSGTSGRAFINGVQIGPTTTFITSYAVGAVALQIGSTHTVSELTRGYVSNFRMVKGTAVYIANFIPPTQPLTAVAGTSLLTLQNNQPTNNSMFVDSSTNNLVITRNGNTTQGTFSPYSPSGWSNYFDGSGDYLDVAGPGYTFSANWTVELWVYATAGGMIFDCRPNAVNGYYPTLGMSSTQLILTFNSNDNFVTPPTSVLNAWNHVAWVKNNGVLTVYFNGASIYSVNDANTWNMSAARPRLGANGGFFSAAPNFYTGYISNFRIVNGTAVYTSAFTTPTQPLTTTAGTYVLTCARNRFVDDSANNFVITRTGDVRVQNFAPFRAQTQTPVSYSAYFDGSGDYLSTPSTAAFTFGTGDFTLEAWIYQTATSAATYRVIFADNVYGSSGGYTLYSYNNALNLWKGGSPAVELIAPAGTIALNTWIHVAWTRSGSSNRLFVNGTQVGATATDATNYTGTVSFIGANNLGTLPFTGYISNARVVKGTAVYTSNFTPSTQPLTATAGTSLLTCQSATFADNSSNQFSITVSGNSQPTQFNPFGFTFVNSGGYSVAESGGSMSFDGSDFLTVPSSTNLATGTSNFTVEAWVYTSLTSGTQCVYDTRQNNDTNTGFYFGLLGSNTLIMYTSAAIALQGGTVPTNAWTHVALVRVGNTFTGYINGTSVGTATSTNNFTNAIAQIGASTNVTNSSVNYLTGYISNLRIVKSQALYTSSFAPPIAPVEPVPNTVLLLNGTAAAITDATTRNVLETVGDARISTAVAKWGGSSMAFDGTGDYIIHPPSVNYGYGTGNFTIEFWVYFNSVSSDQTIASNLTSASSLNPHLYLLGAGSTIRYNTGSADRIVGPAVNINTWYHVAVSRAAGSTRLFVNGVQSGSTYTDSNNYGNSAPLGIGTYYSAGSPVTTSTLNGYMQDFRITTGTARYTANFTPPTAAFFTS